MFRGGGKVSSYGNGIAIGARGRWKLATKPLGLGEHPGGYAKGSD